MAKINTKTFRGGSIPAWALEGYQSESANYADVVRSITSAYDNQQQRNLQEQRLNQQQEQFDETFEYNKQQDLIQQNLKKEDLIFQKNEARRKAIIEADNRTYIKELNEANAFKDNYDVMSDTFGPDIDGLDARLNILNSGDKFNPIIGDYVKSQTAGLNRSKEQWTATSNNVRDIIFKGKSDEELKDSGQDGVLKMYTNGLLKGGKGGDRLFELMLSRAVPELSPDSRIKNKEIITELEGIVELEMTYSGEGENPYTSMREALTTKLQSNIIGVQPDIEFNDIYNNNSILEDYGNSRGISLPEVKANIANGTISNEDLDEYFAGKNEEKTGLIEGLSDFLGSYFTEETNPTIENELNISQLPLEDLSKPFKSVDSETVLNAIAQAESSGDSNAISPKNKNGTFDYGLYQINENWFRTDTSFNKSDPTFIEAEKVAKTYFPNWDNMPNDERAKSFLGEKNNEFSREFAKKIYEGGGVAEWSSSDKVLSALTSDTSKGSTLGMSSEFPEEYKDKKGQFYVDKLKDSVVGLGDYISQGLESVDKSIKDFESEFNLLDTAPGKTVNNFLSYVDDIYKDVEDDSNPNLTPIGKELNQLGKTVGRFFPQIAEDYQIFTKTGQVDKYLTEGTSYVEAIKKARDDIRENQGGVYYSKSGKYITKKQLIGQGNMLRASEDFNADLASLPNKMINPKYIEDKVIELSASMAENVSKVSETSIAGPSLKKVKDNLSTTEKKLRKLKQAIKEAEKYRTTGLYKVTSEQVDNALETIKIAKSKRASRIKNPFPVMNQAEKSRVAKEDALDLESKTSKMRESQRALRNLLDDDILSKSGYYESNNSNNPFGR